MYGKLIKQILNIVAEFSKALFFYSAGKTKKENDINKNVLKSVDDAKKIENEVAAMSSDDIDCQLSKYTRK